MSDLPQLRTFLAVYRAGSVSGAADHLAVAQPTVSLHLKALETHLGRQLFERRPRGMSPTPAADELVGVVTRHIDALEQVLHGEVIGRARRGGVVFIGGPSEHVGQVVLPALRPLIDRGVRIRATFSTDVPILAGLLEGELDLAVLTTAPADPGIEFAALADERHVLVASPAWARRIGSIPADPHGAELLADVPVIAYSEALPLVHGFWQRVFGTRLASSPALTANSLPVIASLAEEGVGIAVLPHHVCGEALADGRLVRLVTQAETPRSPLLLAWHAGMLANPSIRHAADLIIAAAGPD